MIKPIILGFVWVLTGEERGRLEDFEGKGRITPHIASRFVFLHRTKIPLLEGS
jgi:hypothetical protein